MAPLSATAIWRLVSEQHGLVTRAQLIDHGYSAEAIRNRVSRGRLLVRARGVYAVGRPSLTPYGELMVAVLASGAEAAVSDGSAAALWEMRPWPRGPVHVTVPAERARGRPSVQIHRRRAVGPRDISPTRSI